MPRVDYFAYGSNMRPENLRQQCPSAQFLTAARLPDHRLKFTRRSKRWQSGAADVCAERDFAVWGALFSLDRQDLGALDTQEGAGRAYELCETTVVQPDGVNRSAYLYTVIDRSPDEVCPSEDYLDAMLAGAHAAQLPGRYMAFLNYLSEESRRAAAEGFRAGLVVRPTASRPEARGIGLARIHPDDLDPRLSRGSVAVVLHERAIVAALCEDRDCHPGSIELDQSLRHALGLPGRESFGFDIEIAPLIGRVPDFPLLRPRMLALPIWPPQWLDSEKQIAVLHPNTIRLLGLAEGDSVRISASVADGDGTYTLRSITRRAFPGSAPEVHRRGQMRPYPDPSEVYLDLDARHQLGVGDQGTPAWVSSHVGRLVTSRIVLYGLTLFLASASLYDPIGALADSIGLGSALSAIAALGVAATLTLVVVFFDLRAKVHY